MIECKALLAPSNFMDHVKMYLSEQTDQPSEQQNLHECSKRFTIPLVLYRHKDN